MAIPGVATSIPCPVCEAKLEAYITTSKKGRHAIGLRCPRDGRDFRGFVNTRSYVEPMLEKIAAAVGTPVLEADSATAAAPAQTPLQNSPSEPAATSGRPRKGRRA